MIGWLILPLLLYAGIALAMFLMQRSLLYHPAKEWQVLSSYPALQGQELTFSSTDGTLLTGWWLPGKQGYPALVYFHGNAGNLNDRVDKYVALQQAGFSLFALSYRGYGPSQGSPSETGLYRDAEAAITKAVELSGDPVSELLIYGESLGTGVAMEMARRYPIKGLVLEAPFTSVVARAGELYPWLPVSLLLRDRFESLQKVGAVKAPILFFHNEGDEVVPIHHGRTLFAAATSPKKAHWLNGEGHVEFDWPFVAAEIAKFHLPGSTEQP